MLFIDRVPKKEATKPLAITFSNLNRFSKFFNAEKRTKFPTRPLNIFHHTFLNYVLFQPAASASVG